MNHGTIGPRELAGRLGSWNADGAPLAEALASGIERLIADGALPPGTVLPSERRLAERLGVARGTVIAAFDRLRDAALIVTRHGSGSVVTATGSPVTGPREAHVTTTLHDDSIVRGLLPDDPLAIDLRAADWHGTEDLPDEAFAFRPGDAGADGAGHGYEVLGIAPLRTAIAAHLTASGLATTPDQVLVTTGAQQAIALVTQLVVGPRDTVVVEELTYPGAIDAALGQQARLATARVGPHGVELADLRRVVEAHEPRLIYLVPSVHNPTGTTLPAPARARLGELLTAWSAVVVDDRTLADTQLEGVPPPPLAAYVEDPAAARRVVTVGSISKSMWGGLRVGWIRAQPDLIHRLARLRSAVDLGSPVHPQVIATRLLDRAGTILPARRERLRARLDAAEEALRDTFPDWTWRRPDGGLCLWVDLGDVDAETFCAAAGRHGVGLVPGSAFGAGGGPSTRVRVPIGHPTPVVREAVDRLRSAWDEVTSR